MAHEGQAPATAPVAIRPCIYRGNQWLSGEELESHLAALIRLENVGVFLGAGASSGALGGQPMQEVWKQFCDQYGDSLAWLIGEGFVEETETPDIEKLADTIEITRYEWERVKRPRKLRELNKARLDLQRSLIKAVILKEDWWSNPSNVDSMAEELSNHRSLLHKLTAARQPGQPSPWIFTTNYDLAIEWASEAIGLKVTNGFEGLHNRKFSPHNFDLGYRNMLARGEARFGTYNIYLVKLHGSLSWQERDKQSYIEYPTTYLWPILKLFLDGNDEIFPELVVFPTAAKYLQTVGFVLGELIRRFSEFLARPQTCLIICGYSFSDEHLNQILVRALQNPTLQLVIYLPEAIRAEECMNVGACQPWIKWISSLESPQVTIVGGGDQAYLCKLVEQLPDPAIYDEQAARIREMIKEYGSDSNKAAHEDEPA